MTPHQGRFRPGQFVWCHFPFDDKPLRPGPVEHLAYVAQVSAMRDGTFVATCLYTTSRPWRKSDRPPIGIIPVHDQAARELGQKPFVIDARKIAFLPIDPNFFPRLDAPSSGILPKSASKVFQDEILDAIAAVVKRPEYMTRLGPRRPA